MKRHAHQAFFVLLPMIAASTSSFAAAFCFGRKLNAEPPPFNEAKLKQKVDYVNKKCQPLLGKELDYYGFYDGGGYLADNDEHTFLYFSGNKTLHVNWNDLYDDFSISVADGNKDTSKAGVWEMYCPNTGGKYGPFFGFGPLEGVYLGLGPPDVGSIGCVHSVWTGLSIWFHFGLNGYVYICNCDRVPVSRPISTRDTESEEIFQKYHVKLIKCC